jgi:hypothetical protein
MAYFEVSYLLEGLKKIMKKKIDDSQSGFELVTF